MNDIAQRMEQLLAPERGDRLVCATLPMDGLLLQSLPEIPEIRHFWVRPDRGERWLGLGSAWRAERQGDTHLTQLADVVESLNARIRWLDPEQSGQAPRLAVASADDFGLLNLPVVQFVVIDGHSWVTVSRDPNDPERWRDLLGRALSALAAPLEPLAGPPLLACESPSPEAGEWMQLAEQALTALAEGTLEKLVLSRRVRFRAHRALSPRHLLQTLICQQPHCTVFAADVVDGCWLAASPERLLDLRGGRFLCEAVAGTVRRDPYEAVDRELGEWLLRDPKNRREHDLVVEALRTALQPFIDDLEMVSSPRLLRLRGLQHLYTPLAGRLKADLHPLRIADALHPTPAVCGAPRAAARDWLRNNEPYRRELFTGLSGWVDGAGDASLNVVLRCARLQDNRVDLYAGAGLVAGSDALAEWEETELKLGNMIKALEDA